MPSLQTAYVESDIAEHTSSDPSILRIADPEHCETFGSGLSGSRSVADCVRQKELILLEQVEKKKAQA